MNGRAASGSQRAGSDPSRSLLAARRSLGFALILGYIIHGAVHILRGEPYDLLWGCHIAALFVAFGLILRNANLNAIGLIWSCFGLPLWILDIAAGGELIPTATLTHLGAFFGGIIGVRALGMPRRAAWKAVGAYLMLWLVTRVVTPRSANINLAFRVYPGWEQVFSGYPIYLATLIAGGTLMAIAVERAAKRRPERSEGSQDAHSEILRFAQDDGGENEEAS